MKDSIKRQIIATVLVSQFLLAMGLTLAIVLYSRAQLRAAFDIMLQGRADSVLAVIHDSEDARQALILDREKLTLPSGDLVEVRDDNSQVIWRSENWQGPPATVAASTSPGFELNKGESSYRGVVVRKATIFDEEDNRPAPARWVTIVYASSTRELEHRIFKIGFFAAVSSLILLLFAGLFAAYRVTRGLSPVQQLAVEAARVSVRNWNFNPPNAARKVKELAPLVEALEATLVSLQRAFDRERDFMADAAHELKTSVAILKSSLQLLACQRHSAQEYKTGLDSSIEDCGRIEALVSSTLSLARAEQHIDEGYFENLEWVDLLDSCHQAIADLQPIARARNVELRCESKCGLAVKADPEDLQTVWVNLLQNAIQYSPPGSAVSLVVTTAENDVALVHVEDSGSGVPPDQLPYVFDRFHRGDPSRSRASGGFGLGLSICKALVEAYDGRMEITSSSATGTCVSVFLPGVVRVPLENSSLS